MVTNINDMNKSRLVVNLDKLHTTKLGAERIKRNLSLGGDDVVLVCKKMIQYPNAIITRRGKNWYINIDDCEITINAYSFTIITAHKMKKATYHTGLEDIYMSGTYQIINEEGWKRAQHCQIFRNSIEPAFCITVELDITNYLKKVRKKGYSFTFSLIYAVTECANDIEEFRYRFLDGRVVLYDRINTAFTYLNKDTELFKVVNVEMKETLEEYILTAAKVADEQKEYFTGPLGNDVFQFSPLPWVSYTHISHTNSGKKDNATPLFDWGKFFERDGKMLLPFSIQAHHSFVDGIHISKFVNSLQSYLNQF